jgi:hypothetical protein
MSETAPLAGATGTIGGDMAQHPSRRGFRVRVMLMPDDPGPRACGDHPEQGRPSRAG